MSQHFPQQETDCSKERWFWIASPRAYWRTPLICLFAPGLLQLLIGWLAVSRFGFKFVIGFSLVLSFPVLVALFGILISPFFLFSKKRRRIAAFGLLCSIAYIISLFFGVIVGEHIRRAAFVELAERSKPLVEAVKKYEQTYGNPPESLEALIPKFLLQVPTTEMGAYPKYEYVVGDQAKRFEGNPWALYVFTPAAGINFDQFMYFPLQNYPKKGYGGWLEQIGDWAYVHE